MIILLGALAGPLCHDNDIDDDNVLDYNDDHSDRSASS